jgi:hypothetical protein
MSREIGGCAESPRHLSETNEGLQWLLTAIDGGGTAAGRPSQAEPFALVGVVISGVRAARMAAGLNSTTFS